MTFRDPPNNFQHSAENPGGVLLNNTPSPPPLMSQYFLKMSGHVLVSSPLPTPFVRGEGMSLLETCWENIM
jgi:hypothetical protein